MSFTLVTAISIEDVPVIMRSAAVNYRSNAQHDEKVILEFKHLREHYPELWIYAAELLEDMATKLTARIKDVQSREAPVAPVVRTPSRRAVL